MSDALDSDDEVPASACVHASLCEVVRAAFMPSHKTQRCGRRQPKQVTTTASSSIQPVQTVQKHVEKPVECMNQVVPLHVQEQVQVDRMRFSQEYGKALEYVDPSWLHASTYEQVESRYLDGLIQPGYVEIAVCIKQYHDFVTSSPATPLDTG